MCIVFVFTIVYVAEAVPFGCDKLSVLSYDI